MNSFGIDLVNMDELCQLIEIEITVFQNVQCFIFTLNESIKAKETFKSITNALQYCKM